MRCSPAWREHERWIATTSPPLVLRQYREGLLGDELFVQALLHHDVLADRADGGSARTFVFYSSPGSASEAGQAPGTLERVSVARRMQGARGRGRVVIDPASRWWCELNAYSVEYLDVNGHRTVTEADRRRDGT